jgi:hypothetical protein
MAWRSLRKSDDRGSRSSNRASALPFLDGGASFASSSHKSFSSVRRFPSSVVPGGIPVRQCGGRTTLDRGIPPLTQVKPDRLRAVIARLI